MTDKTYNGWTNRETWLINLWLTKDMHDPEFYEAVRACKTASDGAEEIANYMDNLMDVEAMPTQGMFHDLLTAALSKVNWYEIAKDWREEE
jgi:hypothetical protein